MAAQFTPDSPETPDAAATQPTLSPAHLHMLEVESAISPAVIAARGYQTETAKASLARLGFRHWPDACPVQRHGGTVCSLELNHS